MPMFCPSRRMKGHKDSHSCDAFNGNGARLKALANLMLYSGPAISDAATISRTAFVESKEGHSVVLRTAKTGTRISVPLPPGVAKAVLTLPGEHPFWTGTSAQATCTSIWHEAFSRLFAHAGIEATSHRWRHTFSKNLLVAWTSAFKP
jgi:integrase